MQAINEWYAAELKAIEAANSACGPLVLGGGIIYGGVFLGIFSTYCLSSILSVFNQEALRGCTIAFYTDGESHAALDTILGRARRSGINTVVRIVPDAAMQSPHKWELVSAAQHLQVLMAARGPGAFHVMMPDQVYNDRFFPRLLELAKLHKNIVHNGLNAHRDCAVDLQHYRQSDGSLSIPARDLNDIAWKHRHGRMQVIDAVALEAERLVNGHYHLWRARDRILMFGPHNSLSYLSHAACEKLRKQMAEAEKPLTGTMDVWVQRLCDTEFHVPQIDDEISVIGFEEADNPAPRTPDATRQEYFSWCWAQIRYHDPHLIYYREPMANLPTSIDETAPPVEVIMQHQHAFVEQMIANKV